MDENCWQHYFFQADECALVHINTYLQQLVNWKRDINTFTPTTQVQVALNTF